MKKLKIKLLSFAAAVGIVSAAAVGMAAYAEETDAPAAESLTTAEDISGQRLAPVTGWITAENGSITCAAEDGTLLTGVQEIDGQKYLFSENGVLKTGWRTIDGKRYFFDSETGKPVYGKFTYAGRLYCISPEDGKQTGIFTDESDGTYIFDQYGAAYTEKLVSYDGELYITDADGVVITENTELGGIPYVISPAGTVLTGWQTVEDDIRYYYPDGVPAAGIQSIDGETYCFSEDGIMLTGWNVKEGFEAYFDGETGKMLTGWQDIDDKTYYFLEDGSHASGIYDIDGLTYTFGENGAICSGWLEYDGETYYSGADSVVCTGICDIGESRYIFGDDGAMLTGWQTVGAEKFYAGTDGALAVGMTDIDGSTYYFNSIGEMQSGVVEINGVQHRFSQDGVYTPVKICLDAGHFAKYNLSPVNYAYYESDFTWKFHLYLKAELEKRGAVVITTREDKDKDMELIPRGEFSKGCDLFLSIHSNACGSSSFDRPEAWCTITGAADEIGQQLATAVANTMGTYQAGTIMHKVGTYGDWYSVLYGATKVGTPAILLEHSYHTNYRTTVWLMNDDNLKKMAAVEADIIYNYYLHSAVK